MQVSVEAPTKLERRVTVIVPTDQLEEAFDKRVIKFAKTAKLKGFRPGKVPLTYIKQHFGDAVRQEALSDVIQSSLYAAINQEKLNPIGTPTVEPKTIVPGQPLEFVAIFEVLPEVDKIHFTVTQFEKQTATITEVDVEKVIERLVQQHTTWREVDRAAQEKDQVVMDFRGSIDGKFFAGGEAHDYPLVLGSKTMIPGFEEGLIGLKKGEEKVISVTFPEKYHATEMAGKNAEFTIQVRKVSEPELPKMNEALVQKLGIKSGSLDELKTEIRKNLEREVERLIKAKLKNKVFDLLLEQNPLEIPKALIDQEAERIHHEMHPHHGKSHDHGHSEAEMAMFAEAAKRNVALGLLVAEFVKQHQITPTKERIESQLTNLAAAYENPNEVIQWYKGDKRRLAEIEMLILEEQVLEKLLENVAVTEKMLNYNELIAS